MAKKFNPKVADQGRKIIGEFIRDYRIQRNISQDELSEIAGIRRATLSELENGHNYEINTLLAVIGCLRGKLFIEWQDPESIPHFGKPDRN